MLVFWRFGAIICIVAFLIAVKTPGPNFFFRVSVLTPIAGDCFFRLLLHSRLCLWDLFFFLPFFLAGFTMLSRGGVNFGFLRLDYLEQEKSLEP